MAYFEWDPAWDTGIPAIDYEHRKLLDLLNEVDSEMQSGAPPEAVAGTLGEFHSLASAHLALEEKILQDIGDPSFEDHRRHHYQVLDAVREIMDAHRRGAFTDKPALPAALKEWVSELIRMDGQALPRIDDARLKDYGLSRG